VYERRGTWWGEDDDMIFVDDDTRLPTRPAAEPALRERFQ
jgi:hypothetical protein